MSLDLDLLGPEVEGEVVCDCCGVGKLEKFKPRLYSCNITHNVGPMARTIGVYYALWRGEMEIETAKDLIVPLSKGIQLMHQSKEEIKKLEASNGWGTYEDFLPWLEELHQACVTHPEATIQVSR